MYRVTRQAAFKPTLSDDVPITLATMLRGVPRGSNSITPYKPPYRSLNRTVTFYHTDHPCASRQCQQSGRRKVGRRVTTAMSLL